MRDPQDPNDPRAPGERADDRELDSAAGIGPRVSAVFTAAEQAAEHILQMARAEVDDLRRGAEAELEAFRAQRRGEAEREARAIVEDARAEAEMIRTEANRSARSVEDAARRREQWIDEGIRLMVERAEWGRRGLQDVIERLEEFVVRTPLEWPDVGPAPAARGASDFPAGRMAGPPSAAAGLEPEAAPPPEPAPAREPHVGDPEPDAGAGAEAGVASDAAADVDPEATAAGGPGPEPAHAPEGDDAQGETAEPPPAADEAPPRSLSVTEQLQRRFGRPSNPADDGERAGEA